MRVLVIAAVVTASLPGVAQATVHLPVEFGEMVRDSQLVVHGRVIDVRSQQTADRRSIETVVTMSVTEALKGRPGGDVTFRMPGGEVGRYRRVIVGVPRFAPGDEVVVFLRGGAPALPTVFGLDQGLFRVSARSRRPCDRSPGPDRGTGVRERTRRPRRRGTAPGGARDLRP